MGNEIRNKIRLESKDRESVECLSEIVRWVVPQVNLRQEIVETDDAGKKVYVERLNFWTNGIPYLFPARFPVLVKKFSDVLFRQAWLDAFNYPEGGDKWVEEETILTAPPRPDTESNGLPF